MPDLRIIPVTADVLEDVTELFESNGSTRGCWCMAFVVPQSEYHIGRYGGNRAKFEELLRTERAPLGLLGYDDGTPAAWCAAGPRARFERAMSSSSRMMRHRDPQEDTSVWFVPCFFVRVGHRRAGTTRAMLEAAVDLARVHGATAIEGFPLAHDNPGTADGYYGREHVFADVGFTCVTRPTPKRAVMRLEL